MGVRFVVGWEKGLEDTVLILDVLAGSMEYAKFMYFRDGFEAVGGARQVARQVTAQLNALHATGVRLVDVQDAYHNLRRIGWRVSTT